MMDLEILQKEQMFGYLIHLEGTQIGQISHLQIKLKLKIMQMDLQISLSGKPNLPFNQPPQPGNVTIISNDGCDTRTFSIGERFTHFYVWDVKVGDFEGDGNDDIAVLELATDLTTQNLQFTQDLILQYLHRNQRL